MSDINKILLVQLYANGDCLYATTIARQIKNDYPDCHLTWAISFSCRNIIKNNPFVDKILEIKNVKKDDIPGFRKLIKRLKGGSYGSFDEIFITQVIDKNLANYDGSIRSSIFRGYPGKITVPIRPVLILDNEEIIKVQNFAELHNLSKYKSVILFEYAPQSGQSNMDNTKALNIANKLVSYGNIAVILSSANKIESSQQSVIDGSILTIRETAALTHYCNLLLGSSSGLTWISTSSAAKSLPMIQLLNAETTFPNPPSRDFKRFNIDQSKLIELIDFNEQKIVDCTNLALEDFNKAKNTFNQEIYTHFKSSQSIIYNLICYLQFGQILKHIKVNRKVYGDNIKFYQNIFLGIFKTPFKLFRNLLTKRF